MDELTFDPTLKNTDTTQEIEGYDDHIEEVQKAYPEQDWRTPVEVEAEQQQSQEQPTTEAQPQDQINEVATQVADQVGQQLGQINEQRPTGETPTGSEPSQQGETNFRKSPI